MYKGIHHAKKFLLYHNLVTQNYLELKNLVALFIFSYNLRISDAVSWVVNSYAMASSMTGRWVSDSITATHLFPSASMWTLSTIRHLDLGLVHMAKRGVSMTILTTKFNVTDVIYKTHLFGMF